MYAVVADLAGLFAQAAVNGELWIPTLRTLANFTKSENAQLIGIGENNASWFNWGTNGASKEQLEEFERACGKDPRGNTRVRVALGDPVMTLRSEDDYRAVPDDDFSRNYAELCHNAHMPNGCQTVLTANDDGMVGLALLRTEKDGVTDSDSRQLFMAIAPFVRGAIALQRTLESQGRLLALGTLEQMSAIAFICQGDGKVIAATKAAEAMCLGTAITQEQGVLKVASLKDTRRLHQAIARQATATPGLLETLVIAQPAPQPPLVIDVSPLPSLAWRVEKSRDILVAVRSKRRWHSAAPSVLRNIYKLSAAEAEVAMQLARGHSRDEIAAMRGTSLGTVKAQLKSIFSKLGVNREAELIVLLGDRLTI